LRAFFGLVVPLLLTAPVLQAQTAYHGVTISAVIYDPQGSKLLTPIVVNNGWLIEQILNVTAKEAADYALVINDATGFIGIYSKIGGIIETPVWQWTAVTADLANSAGTQIFKEATVEYFSNTSFTGSAFATAKADDHGNLISETITFTGGYNGPGFQFASGRGIGSPAVIKGTAITTATKYNIP
jgi:hypothetical protein